MGKDSILVLGSGLSGLSTSYFLRQKKIRTEIFEKEKAPGGLCRSFKKQGFTFDFSGHLMHFRNKSTLSLVKRLLKGNLVKHKRDSYVYSFDRFIPYPFQTNFDHLPEKQALACLSGLIESRSKKSLKSRDFLQWIHNKFGKPIAELFLIPYNTKLWRMPLHELEYSWAERFIITPGPGRIKPGFDDKNGDLGYNNFFWYLKRGGIEELIKGFLRDADSINLNCRAVGIDLRKKTVKFKNAGTKKFSRLISTIPLPELGKIITPLPDDVKDSFKRLKWVSIYNVNLGLEAITQPARHWIYFSQKNIPFFRVGFFHNFSSSLTPSNKGALYADVSYSEARPIRKKDIRDRVVKQLTATGLIRHNSDVCCKHINDIRYGYPVYDKNYFRARGKILKFLAKNNVISCGRYGGWSYLSMEDVILESADITKGI